MNHLINAICIGMNLLFCIYRDNNGSFYLADTEWSFYNWLAVSFISGIWVTQITVDNLMYPLYYDEGYDDGYNDALTETYHDECS